MDILSVVSLLDYALNRVEDNILTFQAIHIIFPYDVFYNFYWVKPNSFINRPDKPVHQCFSKEFILQEFRYNPKHIIVFGVNPAGILNCERIL